MVSSSSKRPTVALHTVALQRPRVALERHRVAPGDAARVEVVLRQRAVLVGSDDHQALGRAVDLDRRALEQVLPAQHELERRRPGARHAIGEARLGPPGADQPDEAHAASSSYHSRSFGSMSGTRGLDLGQPRAVEPHRLDDQPRRDVVVGPVDELDCVARLQLALLGDREVRARAAGVQELLLEAAHADPGLELEAGDARAGDPQLDRADPPALADARAGDVDARGRQVLAERPGAEVQPGDVAPERDVLARIGVDRLVGPAVDRAVGLVVALQVDAAHRDRALDRRLDDRRLAPRGGR